ncbi:hypothetical protein N2152v2_001075 [Parachlorella kessleri]
MAAQAGNGLPPVMMGHATAEAVVRAGLTLVPYSFTGASEAVAVGNTGVCGIPVELVGPAERQKALEAVRERYPGLIMVDYTLPSAVNENARFYAENQQPFVMGTTGGDREKLIEDVRAAGVYAVIAPNMGKQIVAFQTMMELMAEKFPGCLSGYQLRVVESHQRKKADTSGTAKAVVQSFNKMGLPYQEGDIEKVRDEQGQLHRMGVPQQYVDGHAFHTYTVTSPDGTVTLEFKHNVCGREVYAEGTVDAAIFLARKIEEGSEQRLFNMIDVLSAVTLAGVVLALVLLIAEVKNTMTTRIVQELKVDTSRNERLHITFNISFPALPCEALAMDIQDVSGRFQTDTSITHAKNGEVHKFQLSAEGRRLHIKEYTPPNFRSSNPFSIMLDQTDMDNMRAAMKRHEGCLIYGWVEVPRVAGNLHFTVRPEALYLSMNMEDIIDALTGRHRQLHGEVHADSSLLNASHVINSFNFGPPFPSQRNPLEGMRRIDRKATGIDKYFVKVVATDYHSLFGWKLRTHQYSMTEYYHRLQEFESSPPAVFFLYDMSPILVVIKETRPGLLRLLVRLCAVVGGVFAVTRLLDKLIHALVTSLLGQQGRKPKRMV